VLYSKPMFNSNYQINAIREITSINPLSLRERARVRAFYLTPRNIEEHPNQFPLPLGEG